ncbi:hypothetical protein [Niallia sp. Marseille-Q9988]
MLNHVIICSAIYLRNVFFLLDGNLFQHLLIIETGYFIAEALVYEEDRMKKDNSKFLIEDNRSYYR